MAPVISGGGNAKITQISKSNFSGLRGRMEVGVGAFERYGVLGCTWSVFQALAHIRHAFENFWSKMAFFGQVVYSVPFGCNTLSGRPRPKNVFAKVSTLERTNFRPPTTSRADFTYI